MRGAGGRGRRCRSHRDQPLAVVRRFRKVVDAYEAETGKQCQPRVNPSPASLEKRANSVRAKAGDFDL